MSIRPYLVTKRGMAFAFVAPSFMTAAVQEMECTMHTITNEQKKRSPYDKTITMIEKTTIVRYAAENESLQKHSIYVAIFVNISTPQYSIG